jgi:hypothetical protein
MNKIKQHRPAYVSGYEDAVVSFTTTEELLNIDFVKNFAKDIGGDTFYRFSISPADSPGVRQTLMAEYNNGKKWWVVGFLDTNEGITLPQWSPVYDS